VKLTGMLAKAWRRTVIRHRRVELIFSLDGVEIGRRNTRLGRLLVVVTKFGVSQGLEVDESREAEPGTTSRVPIPVISYGRPTTLIVEIKSR